MTNVQKLRVVSYALALVVCAAALYVWASERLGGQSLGAYDYFPVFGLIAFSLMWTHYILGAVRRMLGVGVRDNLQYVKCTSYVVLVCMLLHPAIFTGQLYNDGYGLPPNSYFAVYTEPVMKGAIMLGTLSLMIFLAYELHRWFRKKSWWKYVNYAQIFAMFAIFYHGLTLGRELSVGWFRALWFMYGVTLFAAIAYNHVRDTRASRAAE